MRFPAKFTVATPAQLRVTSTDIQLEGTHPIEITITHTTVSGVADIADVTFTFDIVIIDNPCVGGLVTPNAGDLDFELPCLNSDPVTIDLAGITNGECTFTLEIADEDVTGLPAGTVATDIFQSVT